MSPVDGFDPFGLIPIYAITPGEYLNVAIPSLGIYLLFYYVTIYVTIVICLVIPVTFRYDLESVATL